MTKEKLAYYGKMSNADFTALFTSQNMTVKEGLTPKLGKKLSFIRTMCLDRGEISLHSLNSLYADSKKIDKRGYFKADEIITFDDLAKLQKLTIQGATCAVKDDALRMLDADGKPLFMEVHRDKKTGSLSVALTVYDTCLCDVTVIPEAEWKKAKEEAERKQLAKLLEKYGN